MKLQFRVLYREFLFRIVDLEVLAPQGDVGKLLGQFAALLLIISLWVLLPLMGMAAGPPSEFGLLMTFTMQHFLIATAMLVVGLFAVLSWESMFPDRRDVLVLAPLPVHARTLFAAKVAAVATALSVTVLALDIFPGLAAPFVFSTAPAAPPPQYDAAMAPVRAADLQPVLDRDLAPARVPGSSALALGRDAGIAIGVLDHGERRVFTYGTAQPDSIFEIGSITKTFTGLLLAQMAAQGKLDLEEPVRELLPQGIVAKPAGGEITLLDLATQHSGLPGMPDNFNPADPSNPYVDYHAATLYAYMAKRGVAKPANTSFLYSNLGLGLLGQALANRAGTTYADLLKHEVTGPLGMRDTVIAFSSEQRPRFIQGHSGVGQHAAVHAWDLDGLAGAGAIRSTAGDMLTYLDAQLHPEGHPVLSAALAESHKLRADISPGRRIALAWWYEEGSGIYQHGGATAGYTSNAFFYPRGDYAVIVLVNTGPDVILGPAQLSEHIRQRLAGEPAVSLAPSIVSGRGGLWNGLRSFAAFWITLFAAGLFVFSFVLSIQGLAQLLPRQKFLCVSSFLQIACFVLFLTVYFLQPPYADLGDLVQNQELLRWLPSYWFFGLFQELNGPMRPELAFLPQRAWTGLAVAGCGAAAAYLICYFRTLRKIAEQPDILPAARGVNWLPAFGNSLQTAVGQFSVRTLLRSRQHRVILSFYLGITFGLAMFISNAPVIRQQRVGDVWYQLNAPLLVASILIMCGSVVGARVVFSMPLELRANWIFRVMPIQGVPGCLAAARRSLYGLAVVPILAVFAVVLFRIWPWRAAAGHLAILALIGMIAAELCLRGFRKIPFTCSYLPGKKNFHMAALAFAGLVFLLVKGAALERSALDDALLFAPIAGVLLAAWVLASRRATALARSEEASLQFEETVFPAIFALNLHRDGTPPVRT